jgi:nicotinamidase-related amidase
MQVKRLIPGRTGVLVIDMQQKLLPVVRRSDELLRRVGRLLDGAAVLDMPVLASEQYPRGLGPTVPQIDRRLERAKVRCEKLRFSACEPVVMQAVRELQLEAVVVAGIECHACVLQTCLDLLEAGLTVGLPLDGTSSRRAVDERAGVARLTQAGVLPVTVEQVLFELAEQAGSQRSRELQPVVRSK